MSKKRNIFLLLSAPGIIFITSILQILFNLFIRVEYSWIPTLVFYYLLIIFVKWLIERDFNPFSIKDILSTFQVKSIGRLKGRKTIWLSIGLLFPLLMTISFMLM